MNNNQKTQKQNDPNLVNSQPKPPIHVSGQDMDTQRQDAQQQGEYPPQSGAGSVQEGMQPAQPAQSGTAPSENQVITPSPSPEIPSRVEQAQEIAGVPEAASEQESVPGFEQRKNEVQQQVTTEDETRVEAPEVIPNLTKFEDPFKVYGYKVSQDVSEMGRKLGGSGVIGDTSSAKTWLIVLVGRLLRMGNVLSADKSAQ